MHQSRNTVISAGVLLLSAAVDAIPPPEVLSSQLSTGGSATEATSLASSAPTESGGAAGTGADESVFPTFTLDLFGAAPTGDRSIVPVPSDGFATGVVTPGIFRPQFAPGIFPPGIFPTAVYPSGSGGEFLFPSGSGMFAASGTGVFAASGTGAVLPTGTDSGHAQMTGLGGNGPLAPMLPDSPPFIEEEDFAPRRRSESHFPCWTKFFTPPWCQPEQPGEQNESVQPAGASAPTPTPTDGVEALINLLDPQNVPGTQAPGSPSAVPTIDLGGLNLVLEPVPSGSAAPVNPEVDPIYTASEIPIFSGSATVVNPANTQSPVPGVPAPEVPVPAPEGPVPAGSQAASSAISQASTSVFSQTPMATPTNPTETAQPNTPESVPQPPGPIN